MNIQERLLNIALTGEYIEEVDVIITQIIHERKMRKEPPVGFKYKRDEIQKLLEQDLLNKNYFVKEYPIILYHKSNLSSQRREIITHVCSKAIIKYYNQNYKENE